MSTSEDAIVYPRRWGPSRLAREAGLFGGRGGPLRLSVESAGAQFLMTVHERTLELHEDCATDAATNLEDGIHFLASEVVPGSQVEVCQVSTDLNVHFEDTSSPWKGPYASLNDISRDMLSIVAHRLSRRILSGLGANIETRAESDLLGYGWFFHTFQIASMARIQQAIERVEFCTKMSVCRTWEELRCLFPRCPSCGSDQLWQSEFGEHLDWGWWENGWDASLEDLQRPDDWYPATDGRPPWPLSDFEWVEEESWINQESMIDDLPQGIRDLAKMNSLDQVWWDRGDLGTIRELATEAGFRLVKRLDLFSKCEGLDISRVLLERMEEETLSARPVTDVSIEVVISRVLSVEISNEESEAEPTCEVIARAPEPNFQWTIYWAPGNEVDDDGNYVGPISCLEPTTFDIVNGGFLAALNQALDGGDTRFEFVGIDMQEALRLIAETELGAPPRGDLYVNGNFVEWEGREVIHQEPEGSG